MKAPDSEQTALFRQEVVRAQGEHHLGSIRIGRNPGFAVVAMVALGLAAALVAFAVWGEFSRKARLPGVLVPEGGLIELSSPQPGTVLQVLAREGEPVAAGQPLLVIGTDRHSSEGPTAALIARSLSQRRDSLLREHDLARLQSEHRQRALAARLHSLQSEAQHAAAEQQALTHRLQLAHKSQQRYLALASQGFVAEVQAQQKHEELIELQIRERNLQRSRSAFARDIEQLRAERMLEGGALQALHTQFERALAALDQESAENQARAQLVLSAARAGRVSALSLNPGQAVHPGVTLASLMPIDDAGHSREMQAQLFAPSRTAGFVQRGQTVWLRYAAYPHQKFGMGEGRIESVSKTPINPQDLPSGQGPALLAAARSNEPLYRVTVALKHQSVQAYGKALPLKPGLALEADVVQDRRAVWEWLLEPVLASGARARV
jgi:membrane fusion protein